MACNRGNGHVERDEHAGASRRRGSLLWRGAYNVTDLKGGLPDRHLAVGLAAV